MTAISTDKYVGLFNPHYVLLHSKYFVLQELIDCVRFQLEGLYWRLDVGKTYTARRMCGEPFWALLCTRERQLIGSCISHLAQVGELPIVKVSEDRCYPNQYEVREIQ